MSLWLKFPLSKKNVRLMKILAVILFCTFVTLGFGQNIDPKEWYENALRISRPNRDDTSKVIGWTDLANYHKFKRPDSGIYYANKAILLARRIRLHEQELSALNFLALSYATLGNNTKALKIDLEGLKKSEEYGLKYAEADFRIGMGSRYAQLGKYDDAIAYQRRAQILYDSLEAFDMSIIAGNLISGIYGTIGKFDSAFMVSYEMLGKANSRNVNWVMYNAALTHGRIHEQAGNLDSALYYYKWASNLDIRSVFTMSDLELAIAKLYEKIGQMDSCLLHAESSLQSAKENGQYMDIMKAYDFLSHYYEKQDVSKALEYRNMAFVYKDSIYNMDRISAFEELTVIDAQQRQQEIDEAKKEFQSRIRTNAFLGSSFTLIVIVVLLYWNNRQKQRSNKKIEAAYERLKNTQNQLIQSEKMASLGELTAGIAHEIQNPLNFVNNFSEVNSELLDELEQAAGKGDLEEIKKITKDIKNNEQKIVHHGKRADGIVKGMLQHSRATSGQKEPTDINALCDEYLRLAFHGMRAKDKSFNAKFETDFEPSLPKVDVIPQDIGRVVLNLITNAFYAVHEKNKAKSDVFEPTVTVSTKKEGDQVLISIKDNGNGIPDSIKDKIFQPFFTTKPTGSGTGLGLSLSYDIVKAHGGELKVESKEGEGSEFVIELPIV